MDVTPPQISAWQKISLIDAGQFDANTAYAAVNTMRLDDMRPHIYRTHDGGKTWKEIIRGIPDGQIVNVVREDTQRRGLLFAGAEHAVYFSLDDGESWQSLRLNMPATSVRDLIIKDDDIAVGTHGRGFWILDNIAPLRQVQRDEQKTRLFKPQTALRIRSSLNTDTPLPPDEPAGENPPDGAMIDYRLEKNSSSAVTLEIRDGKGNVVRRYASTDPVAPVGAKLKIPTYWVRPPQALSSEKGIHRFLWDMHYAPVPDVEPEYPMAAVYGKTAPEATSPWAVPGEYSVVLTANGESFTQPLTVKIDPRVKASAADLAEQLEQSKKVYETRSALQSISKRINSLGPQLAKAIERVGRNPVVAQLDALNRRVQDISGALNADRPNPGLLAKVGTLFANLQGVDIAPTPSVRAAVVEVQREAQSVIERCRAIESEEIPVLDRQIEASGFERIEVQD